MKQEQRYPSDLTDEQWAVLESLILVVKPGGRPAKHSRRQIVNAILYTLRTGCQWRMLPRDYPPWHTVYDYFWQWRNSGLWEQVNTALREQVRKKAHREPTPSAAIIDSQSAKTSEKGGRMAMTAARK